MRGVDGDVAGFTRAVVKWELHITTGIRGEGFGLHPFSFSHSMIVNLSFALIIVCMCLNERVCAGERTLLVLLNIFVRHKYLLMCLGVCA